MEAKVRHSLIRAQRVGHHRKLRLIFEHQILIFREVLCYKSSMSHMMVLKQGFECVIGGKSVFY